MPPPVKVRAPKPSVPVRAPAVRPRRPDPRSAVQPGPAAVAQARSPLGNAAVAAAMGGRQPGPAALTGPMMLAGQSLVGNQAVAGAATAPPPKPSVAAPPPATKPEGGAEEPKERPDKGEAKKEEGGRRSPHGDPKFQALKKDVTAKKKRVAGSHPPATAEAGSAQAAAVAPAGDQEARGKAAHADDMDAAQPKQFDKQAFIEAVKQAVKDKAPKNLDEADKFGESGKAEEIKTEVQGKVGEGKDASAQEIADTTAAPPAPAPDAKQVVPMAADPVPGKPGAPNPAQATPDPLPPSVTDMSAGPDRVGRQLADAHVTEQQLSLEHSHEPSFGKAVKDKKAMDAHSAAAPKKLRAEEKGELDEVKAGAATRGAAAMTGIHATRVATGKQVGTGKQGAKKTDEDRRKEATDLLQKLFDETKGDVEKILTELDKKVDDEFTTQEKTARDTFTREHEEGMARYKDERYSGWDGWWRWTRDQFAGLPEEANRIYEQARDRYLTAMDRIITGIAGTVERELKRAKDRIATGRKDLRAAVERLPADLKAIGRQAAADFAGKFDELTETVDDKGSELVDTLATKYTDAVKAVDDEIAAEKEKNKGLVAKAADAIGGAIKAILELGRMLLGALAKAASAIPMILLDPIGFLGNLVTGVGGGLKLFMKNAGRHLEAGVLAWLLGTAATAGIQLPASFDVLGILTLIATLLGLSWANIRSRLARKVPTQALVAAETAVPLVAQVKRRGVAGLWDELKTRVGDLKKDLIDNLVSYLLPTIIIAGITWIVSLFNPASAFIRACKMIIDIIRFIVTNARRIIEFVNAVLDAVLAIARGGTGGVPALVERALARAIPVLIGALAAILGIGGIAGKVREIFQKLSRPVNRAIDWVIDKITGLIKKLWAKLKPKPRKPKRPTDRGRPGKPKRPRTPKKPARPKTRRDKDKKRSRDDHLKAPRKKFADARAESHEIFFVHDELGAPLMIHSTTEPIGKYLQDWKREIAGVTEERTRDAQLRAWTRAQDLVVQIDARKASLQGTPAARQMTYKFVLRRLDELAATLAVRKTLTDPPLPPPLLPPFVDDVLAMPFKARYINKKIKQGSAAGTNKGSTLRGWSYVQSSGFNKTYRTSWVKMHLLPAFLGGDARDSNLIPARGFTNNPLFLKATENPARKSLTKKKGDPGFERMIWYSVEIDYYRMAIVGFPSAIRVTWGGYDSTGGNWVERSATNTFSDRQDRPLPPALDILRINKVGAKLIARLLGVSNAEAKAIKKFVASTPFIGIAHAVSSFPQLATQLQSLHQAGRIRFD
ncbi:HPC2 multi-domain protein [Amycolatopsis sp. CA-128772]|uniref:phage tail protein n=1 Tax=Amycolatopsis sp. CA-128772 TaxID=2073159 RepID=UPI000CD071D7|nr:HPC2 multi-domain protein [Amycolatopsis sp. CA-128772]